MPNFQEKVMNNLPDSYCKSKDCNNYKLFQCITPEFDLLVRQILELRKSINIDYAHGGTLDKIALNVNQARGSVNDIVLRTLMKAKIAADMSEGTIDTLLDVIGFIIGDETNKSQVEEMYNDSENPEPAAINIIVPAEGIIDAGVTLGQFVALITNIKAAGVRVYANLQGTFEFGEIAEYGPEYDTGFADIEQTTGGSLGILYDPENDEPLPI